VVGFSSGAARSVTVNRVAGAAFRAGVVLEFGAFCGAAFAGGADFWAGFSAGFSVAADFCAGTDFSAVLAGGAF
jgi:hypothetical protein